MDGDLQQVFNHCLNHGVTLFDSGDSYGTGRLNGRSETLLGQFAQAYDGPNQDQLCLATKLAAYPWRLTSGSVVKAGVASAQRLARPIDLVQMHWSTANYAPWQEGPFLDGLMDLCTQGQAKAIGLSNFGPPTTKAGPSAISGARHGHRHATGTVFAAVDLPGQ
jgi:pyridoxine 4-dehydrogenase